MSKLDNMMTKSEAKKIKRLESFINLVSAGDPVIVYKMSKKEIESVKMEGVLEILSTERIIGIIEELAERVWMKHGRDIEKA